MQAADSEPKDDFAKESADAEVKASAFQTSIDHMVSSYQQLMETAENPEMGCQMLTHVAAVIQRLKQSLPVTHLELSSGSEEDDDHSQRIPKAPSGAANQHRPKVPAGTASSAIPAADVNQQRSTEHARHRDSSETRSSSTEADYGPAEQYTAAPGSSTSLLGFMRSTYLRHTRVTSPPPARSSSPPRFSAHGTSFANTSRVKKKLSSKSVSTGADFSAYNSNPFYQNSSVTLPILPTQCVPSGTDYPPPPQLHFKGITDTPFTGDIRSYPRWRDAFIRLVHAPGRYMQDCERLLYLQQCLEGLPLDLASKYPINDLGYHFATAQLERTYFDPKQVRFLLRNDLQALRPPTDNYADLLRFQQEVVHICGNFFQAGEDITENDWCFDYVMAKLPYSVRYVITERSMDQGDSSPETLSNLLEELQRILNVMRKTSLYDVKPEQPSGSWSDANRPLAIDGPRGCSSEPNGGVYVGAIQHDNPMGRQPCAFCGIRGQHWTSNCSKHVTVADRYARAKELMLCFVCLRKDHWRTNAKPCRVPENRLCAFCGKARHHQALCPTFLYKKCAEGSSTQRRNNHSRQTDDDQRGRPYMGPTPKRFTKTGFEEARVQTNAQPPANYNVRQTDDDQSSVLTRDSNAPIEPDEDELEPFDPHSFYSGYAAVGVAHASEARTHGTFLECGMVTVFNPITNKRKRVCAFFDCGSTGTFVSTEVADALGLPNLGSESLRLGTFAQDKHVRLDTFRTTIGFDQTDGTCLVLDLKASPKLVPPLEAVFITPSDEALLRRNRCNLVPQNVVPDILIGKDTETLFRKEYEHPPLPNGFTLLRTTIGTILSGYGQFRKRSSDLTRTVKGSSDPDYTIDHVSFETLSEGSSDPPDKLPTHKGTGPSGPAPAATAHRASTLTRQGIASSDACQAHDSRDASCPYGRPITAERVSVFAAHFSALENSSGNPVTTFSDAQPQKDPAAHFTDKQPTPQATADATLEETVTVPMLTRPSRRRLFTTSASFGSRPAGGLPRISAGRLRRPPLPASEHNATGQLSAEGSRRHQEPRKCTRGREAATVEPRPSENHLVYKGAHFISAASKVHKEPGRRSTSTSPDRRRNNLAATHIRRSAASQPKKTTKHHLMQTPTRPSKHPLMHSSTKTCKHLLVLPAQHAATPPANEKQPNVISHAESLASSSNQDYRQAEKHPSRPSTTDTVSDLSDAPLPLQLPSIGPSGAACAKLVLQSATTLEQLLARMNADSSGDYTRRVFAHLKQANLLEPSGSQQQQSPSQSSSLPERLQLTSSDPTTDQTEPTTPLPTDESPPSKQTHDSEVSSDTIDQAAPTTASNDSLDESTEEDEDGSLSETDEESRNSDSYSGPSHGNDRFRASTVDHLDFRIFDFHF